MAPEPLIWLPFTLVVAASHAIRVLGRNSRFPSDPAHVNLHVPAQWVQPLRKISYFLAVKSFGSRDVAEIAQNSSCNRRPSVLSPARRRCHPLPHTQETHHLFGCELLERMKDGSPLVNVVRGGVIDADYMLKIVQSGRTMVALDARDPNRCLTMTRCEQRQGS
jgi:D-isomer specific 2-hydroxyacid dehydrogenase, NAD binding domain